MSPVLYPPHDGSDADRVSASSPDPLVMYLVAPRRPSCSTGELLVGAAHATLRCSDRFSGDPEWAPGFRDWQEHSFRKVCLRARPAEMERAASLPHAAAGEVLCFPPRRRSAAEPELARLQAHIGPPLEPAAEGLGELPVSVMLLLICRELGLTAGKACAQVGHGVLLGVMLHQAEAVARWRAGGCPVAVGLVDDAVFDHVKRSLSVAAVRDAGLTQVRPGTETVLACMPGETLPGWLLGGARAIV